MASGMNRHPFRPRVTHGRVVGTDPGEAPPILVPLTRPNGPLPFFVPEGSTYRGNLGALRPDEQAVPSQSSRTGCSPMSDRRSESLTTPAIEALMPADWEAVRAIYREGIATGNATFEAEAPDWETWDKGRRADGRLVARSGGRVVAWAAPESRLFQGGLLGGRRGQPVRVRLGQGPGDRHGLVAGPDRILGAVGDLDAPGLDLPRERRQPGPGQGMRISGGRTP